MPLELKVILTWAVILLCIMFAGIGTIGNDTAQEILKPLSAIWMVSGAAAGLFYMWRKL